MKFNLRLSGDPETAGASFVGIDVTFRREAWGYTTWPDLIPVSRVLDLNIRSKPTVVAPKGNFLSSQHARL